MVKRGHIQVLCSGVLLLLVAFSPVLAQTFTINAVSSNTPSFGNLGAAVSGVTVFRISPAGVVSVVSGNGGDTPSGTQTAATVTIRCTGGTSQCSGGTAIVKIDSTNSQTGRAGEVRNFTVASGTATVGTVTVNGDGSIQFPVTNHANNTNRTIFVGMDMPINGDGTSSATTATSVWSVNVAKSPTVPSLPGTNSTATATVRKAISATTTTLGYGLIWKPSSGSGTVTINSSTGARTAGGSNAPTLIPGGTSGRGTVVVSGQASQTMTITTPATFTLSNGVTTLTSTVTRTATGSVSLSSGGAYTLGIGGVLTVPANATGGNYSGAITAVVAYN
jgi:hypothetical protein